jgi:hypothetical protein
MTVTEQEQKTCLFAVTCPARIPALIRVDSCLAHTSPAPTGQLAS